MNVDVIFSQKNCYDKDVLNKQVIIIDVFRTTTVITTAIFNDATKIKIFSSIENALDFSRNYENKNILLGGENNFLKIDGFNLGNSPSEFTSEVVKEKEILLSSLETNQGINKARNGNIVYFMSFLNINAVIKKILQNDLDVLFLCVGLDGQFSTPDIICAGVCINHLSKIKNDLILSDSSKFLSKHYSNSDKDLNTLVEDSKIFNILKNKGFSEDIEYSLTLSMYDSVPTLDKNDWIIK